MFHQMLKYKAEEADIEWIEIPTREVKPSQTCHMCGHQERKPLAVRKHDCGCGAQCMRDENAAFNLEKLKSVLDSGANIDELDRFGQSALLVATNGGLKLIVKELLDRGADMDIQYPMDHDITALMAAADKNQIKNRNRKNHRYPQRSCRHHP